MHAQYLLHLCIHLCAHSIIGTNENWQIEWKVNSETQSKLNLTDLENAVSEVCDYPIPLIDIKLEDHGQIHHIGYYHVSLHVDNLSYSKASQCLLNIVKIVGIEMHFQQISNVSDWIITPSQHKKQRQQNNKNFLIFSFHSSVAVGIASSYLFLQKRSYQGFS